MSSTLTKPATPTTKAHWLARYRRLADVTSPLSPDDPRFRIIVQLLNDCEHHERAGNDQRFIDTAKQIVNLMTLPTSPSLPNDIEPPHPPNSLHSP